FGFRQTGRSPRIEGTLKHDGTYQEAAAFMLVDRGKAGTAHCQWRIIRGWLAMGVQSSTTIKFARTSRSAGVNSWYCENSAKASQAAIKAATSSRMTSASIAPTLSFNSIERG